jgi:protein-export membrane protein SecD
MPPRAARYLLVCVLAVLVAAYGVAALVMREQWAGDVRQERTVVTFSAQTPDGSPAPDEALEEAGEILGQRVAALGVSGDQVVVADDVLTVTVPGDGDGDAARDIGRRGQLYVRPVIHAIAANSAPAPPSTPPPPPSEDLAQRIADEKQLRQGTDQQIQLLALQFQATRCGDDDVLAGNDDPELPLITCSSDGDAVYLLGESLLNSAEVESATAVPDRQRGEYAVELSFDDVAVQKLAAYIAANDAQEVAITVDASVDSTPRIKQVISDGQAMITGDFTEGQASGLASTLANGPLLLELTTQSSVTETVAVERGWTLMRIWLVAAGVILAAVVIGVVGYLISASRRQQPRV